MFAPAGVGPVYPAAAAERGKSCTGTAGGTDRRPPRALALSPNAPSRGRSAAMGASSHRRAAETRCAALAKHSALVLHRDRCAVVLRLRRYARPPRPGRHGASPRPAAGRGHLAVELHGPQAAEGFSRQEAGSSQPALGCVSRRVCARDAARATRARDAAPSAVLQRRHAGPLLLCPKP